MFKIITIFFLLLLCSCSTFERNLQDKTDTKSKEIFISFVPKNYELSGSGSDGIFKNENFKPVKIDLTRIKIDTLEKAKNDLEKYFKSAKYDQDVNFDQNLSFEEMILNINKAQNRKFDYYLFLLPRSLGGDKNSSLTEDFARGCLNIACLAIVPIYISEVLYKGNQYVYSFISNEKGNKPNQKSDNLQFKISYYPYKKDRHKFECLTSFDLVLLENNQRRFVAYKRINYSRAMNIDVDSINYKLFSSYDNFLPEQQKEIEENCPISVDQAVSYGLYKMNLIGSE